MAVAVHLPLKADSQTIEASAYLCLNYHTLFTTPQWVPVFRVPMSWCVAVRESS
jgi:hypothetical protein